MRPTKSKGRAFNAGIRTLCQRLLPAAVLLAGRPARALAIVPTFDSSITTNANAAVIENTINTAIQLYETRFSDPITVTVEFKTIGTAGLYGHSSWWNYTIPYSQFRTALQQDSTTTNDTLALAHLPSGTTNPVTGTTQIRVKTANLRAIGITGMNSGLPGGYDGIMGLHVTELNLSRPSTDPNKGDLLATVEHEMDEILGLASSLDSNAGDPLPEDLFRYTAEGTRTFTTNGDDAYFSLDGANLLERLNQDAGEDYGDWWSDGPHTPQVQDAFATNGAMPDPKTELIALDVIGYNLLPVPHPVITGTVGSGTQLVLNGTNGLAGGTYFVLAQTNIATPLNQWNRIATNYFTNSGNFTLTVTNAINAAQPKRFFALQLQ
jgi:hypothetical protein